MPHFAEILKESARKFSLNVAIEDLYDNKISYKELYLNASTISKLLGENNISRGDRVGIFLPKTIDAVQIIFSVLMVNAAYVPLDVKAPMKRISNIYNDCSLQALFIDKNLISDFVSFNPKDLYTEIDINKNVSLLVSKEKKQKHKEELAYIIYTSGSTGIPKGVMHTHTSAYAFVKWGIDTFTSDRFFSYAPFHFDLSIFDLFVSISCGATLVLSDERATSNPMLFAQFLSEKKISILYATPSVLSLLATFGKMEKHNYSSLHTILFAGEVFPIAPLKKLKNYLPHTQFYNLYGPTETNVCTWFKIPDMISDEVKSPFPIGMPCDYAQYKISNTGELLIAGSSLMSGYWNDEQKTNTSFEVDKAGVKWYKTGDIVELNPDTDLVYVGRNDRMVKRNAYRIELDEIEQNISRHNNIAQVAVTARSENGQTNTIITAHIVWVEKNKTSVLDLINFCNSVLPSYMIPDNFMFHDELPTTSTHKIDYKKLT